MAFPFLLDWNNPTAPAPRPSQGSKINYVDEPANPGIKAILDQYTDEFKSLALNMDASVAGRGLQFGNIANGAIRPENMRPRIDQPYKNYHVQIDSGLNNGSGYIQVDGQPLIKKPIVPVFQTTPNFRNFQPGIDNVTTVLDIIIDKNQMTGIGGLKPGNDWSPSPWYTVPQGFAGAADNRNCKIYIEVGSSIAMTDAVLVSKESFYGYANYTAVEQGPWVMKVLDKTPKLYPNPCYRITFGLEKAPSQAAGVSMQIALQATATVTVSQTNSAM
jgi:hypothetical protein